MALYFKICSVAIVLSVLCGSTLAQKKQYVNPSILQDSRDLPQVDGTFGFLYRTEDGIAHGAVGDPNGQIHGRFTYTDPTGLKVNFNYNAGSRTAPGANYEQNQPSQQAYSQPRPQPQAQAQPRPRPRPQPVYEEYDEPQPEYEPQPQHQPRPRPRPSQPIYDEPQLQPQHRLQPRPRPSQQAYSRPAPSQNNIDYGSYSI